MLQVYAEAERFLISLGLSVHRDEQTDMPTVEYPQLDDSPAADESTGDDVETSEIETTAESSSSDRHCERVDGGTTMVCKEGDDLWMYSPDDDDADKADDSDDAVDDDDGDDDDDDDDYDDDDGSSSSGTESKHYATDDDLNEPSSVAAGAAAGCRMTSETGTGQAEPPPPLSRPNVRKLRDAELHDSTPVYKPPDWMQLADDEIFFDANGLIYANYAEEYYYGDDVTEMDDESVVDPLDVEWMNEQQQQENVMTSQPVLDDAVTSTLEQLNELQDMLNELASDSILRSDEGNSQQQLPADTVAQDVDTKSSDDDVTSPSPDDTDESGGVTEKQQNMNSDDRVSQLDDRDEL